MTSEPLNQYIATPKYECVLVDPNDLNRKHIYIQVKKGDVDDHPKIYFYCSLIAIFLS